MAPRFMAFKTNRKSGNYSSTWLRKQSILVVILSIIVGFCYGSSGNASAPILLGSNATPMLTIAGYGQQHGSPVGQVSIGSSVTACVSLSFQHTDGSNGPIPCVNLPFLLKLTLIDALRKPIASEMSPLGDHEAVEINSSTGLPVSNDHNNQIASMTHTFRAGASMNSTCFTVIPFASATGARVVADISLITNRCMQQCSDGNVQSGDGCSAEGQIERDTACVRKEIPSLENATLGETLPTTHNCNKCQPGYYTNGTMPCTPARSCLDVLSMDCSKSASGLYPVILLGDNNPTNVYCDMTTQGGPWMLAAKFSQWNSSFGLQLSDTEYDAFFKNDVWIKGSAQGIPSSPAVNSSANISIESLDWRKLLVSNGSSHRIRQRLENVERLWEFDASFAFTYGGVVTQNDATSDSQKKWDLTDRQVIKDTSGLPFVSASSNMLFILPFLPGYGGNVYSACGGYSFDTSGCNSALADRRRFGNAGILLSDPRADNVGIGYMPHPAKSNGYPFDVAGVFEGTNSYQLGLTANSMVATYWIGEGDQTTQTALQTCAAQNVNECLLQDANTCHAIGGICIDTPTAFRCRCKAGWTGDGHICIPLFNCSSLLAMDPNIRSGTYNLLGNLNDQGLENATARPVFCDFSTAGGPWALAFKVVQNGPNTKPTSVGTDFLDTYFKNGLWIHGDSEMLPYDDKFVKLEGLDKVSLESHDWRWLLGNAGQKRRLRQTAINRSKGKTVDLYFSFVYNGVTRQNDAFTDSDKKWDLFNRTILYDDSGITWSSYSSNPVYFFLPYQAGVSGPVYSGCSSYSFSASTCNVAARYGAAGIVSPDGEYAIPWLPLMTSATNEDWIWSYDGRSLFGETNGADLMYGMYWLSF